MSQSVFFLAVMVSASTVFGQSAPAASTTAASLPSTLVIPIIKSSSYPADAKSPEIEGTVVIQAVIDKTGHTKNIHIISGPNLLRQSAVDAVQQLEYKAYEHYGSLVEVGTTIDVVFKRDSK